MCISCGSARLCIIIIMTRTSKRFQFVLKFDNTRIGERAFAWYYKSLRPLPCAAISETALTGRVALQWRDKEHEDGIGGTFRPSTYTINCAAGTAHFPVACDINVKRNFVFRTPHLTVRRRSMPRASAIRDGVGAAQHLKIRTNPR